MAELILPGVYIEVRAEALIVPGPISVGNVGIVGTASRGPVGEVKVLGSFAEAKEVFGPYDPFENPLTANNPLTLVRALELAYSNGASTVYAVRIASAASATAFPSATDMTATNAGAFDLTAKNPGTTGDNITITIVDVPVNKAKVTIKSGAVEEEYTVANGQELVNQINDPRTGSNLVKATADTNAATTKPAPIANVAFSGGNNGADVGQSDYANGLAALQNQNAHIIVAAGQNIADIGDELLSHVETSSNDEIKRDRIAVVGSAAKLKTDDDSAFIGKALDSGGKPPFAGERLIYVIPGVKVTEAPGIKVPPDAPTLPKPKEVTLPGAYAAAAVAGMLSARSPHISLTNKALSVGGLEAEFTAANLKRLVQANVLALERRRGFRVVKGITTDTGAFQQITTRRIVDFAKFGVRGAAEPFIGLLNNERVRAALKGSINGFLADMVTDELLISYELDVTATRDEEIRGIARVTMTVRPTFSIDYIKVVMFLG
jgi:hypothetical protein